MKRYYTHTYPSVDALVTAALGPSKMRLADRYSREGGEDEWYGNVDWEDAVKMGQHGDIEGAKRLGAKIVGTVNSFVHGQKRLDPVFRLDEGQWIDVARFVKGEPECWGAMIEADPVPHKGAHIAFNVAARGHVPASAMDKVGQAVGSAILGLQALGYSVSVYFVACSDGINDPSATGIIGAPLNPGGSPLDVSKLSAILRPWFFRRLIFSLKETFDEKYRKAFEVGHGYGCARPLTVKEVKETFKLTDTPIVVDIMDMYKKSEKEIFNSLVKQIQGGK